MRRQDSIKGQGKRRLRFFGEAVSELRKVVVTVLVAIILGVIDFGFSKLMNVILVR